MAACLCVIKSKQLQKSLNLAASVWVGVCATPDGQKLHKQGGLSNVARGFNLPASPVNLHTASYGTERGQAQIERQTPKSTTMPSGASSQTAKK